jgi:hypothetical protein
MSPSGPFDLYPITSPATGARGAEALPDRHCGFAEVLRTIAVESVTMLRIGGSKITKAALARLVEIDPGAPTLILTVPGVGYRLARSNN